MMTADGIHLAFSGRYPKHFFNISDLYRVDKEIAEMHYTPVTLSHRCIAYIAGLVSILIIIYGEGLLVTGSKKSRILSLMSMNLLQ